MSELTERLFDHRWEDPSVAEMKVLRNEAGNQIEDLEKAICIFMRENPVDDIEFDNDEEAIQWFIGFTNAVDKDEEFVWKTAKEKELDEMAKAFGTTADNSAFKEIMEQVDNEK